jgi:hypothetical protein
MIKTVKELIAELEQFNPNTKICIQVQDRHSLYAGVARIEEYEKDKDFIVIRKGNEEYEPKELFRA